VSIFVDTAGWGYLFDTSNMDLHQQAALIYQTAKKQRRQLITSNYVLCELVALLHSSWRLLQGRIDKQWSLVDCSSFVVMQEHQVTDVLTTDHHFQQAGFQVLLSRP
jgi:uncharacterized protein